MRTSAVPLVFLVLLLALACIPLPAFAQKVHRCEGMDGKPVFTDKRCEDVGAMDALPRPATPTIGNTGISPLRGGCSRTLNDLVQRITYAIDNRDVNQLASAYQWAGTSDAQANRILDRLEDIVERPLLDVEPIRPSPPPLTDEAGNIVDANADGYYPQTATPARPVGLRVMQTLRNGSATTSTVFGLRLNYGCFWISL